MKLEQFIAQRFKKITELTTAVTNNNGHANVKHMNVYSLSVIFFSEAALKRRLRATA